MSKHLRGVDVDPLGHGLLLAAYAKDGGARYHFTASACTTYHLYFRDQTVAGHLLVPSHSGFQTLTRLTRRLESN